MDVAQSALTRFVVGQHARMTVLADCFPTHRQQSAKKRSVIQINKSAPVFLRFLICPRFLEMSVAPLI
jgi:hypothetical protein